MKMLALAASLLAFAPVVAQTKPAPVFTARSFLPDQYQNVAFVDLAALRDHGIQDVLDASVLKTVFTQLEKETGFPLTSLDRATQVAVAGGDEVRHRTVTVLEGNKELPLPPWVTGGRWTESTAGEHVLYRREGRVSDVFVCPRPNLQVFGDDEFVLPALEGKRGGGGPCPDVMSLLSGRGDHLAYAVFFLDTERNARRVLDALFPETKWPEGGKPTFFVFRLRKIGTADDPHVELELVVRHEKEGDGVTTTDAAWDALLERLKKDAGWLSFRPLLARAQKRRDHADVVVAADLGTPREAVGHAALLFGKVFARQAQEQPDEAAAAPAAPAPATPKKQ